MAIDKNDPEVQQIVRDAVTEANAALEENRNTILTEKRGLETKLKTFGDLDPKKYAELVKADEDREAANAKKRGDWEALDAKRKDELTALMAAKDEEIAKRDVVIEDALVGQAVIRAITEADGNPLLIEHPVRAQVRLEDGQAVVVDAEGKRRLVGAEHMTIPQLVDEFKQNDAYAGAFAGTGSRGSGTPTGTGRGKMPVGTVDANDPVAMGKNLEAIVDGSVVAKY